MDPQLRYDQEDDVLLVWFSHKHAARAEMFGTMVMHVSEDGDPVLLEILGASHFLDSLNDIITQAKQMVEEPHQSIA